MNKTEASKSAAKLVVSSKGKTRDHKTGQEVELFNLCSKSGNFVFAEGELLQAVSKGDGRTYLRLVPARCKALYAAAIAATGSAQ